MSIRGLKIVAAMRERTEEISRKATPVVKEVFHNHYVIVGTRDCRGMGRSTYVCRNFR